jgi:hypothetical protein
MSLEDPFEELSQEIKDMELPVEVADALRRWVKEHLRLIKEQWMDIQNERMSLMEDSAELAEMWETLENTLKDSGYLTSVEPLLEKVRQRKIVH